MRILVTIPHYCGPPPEGQKAVFNSQLTKMPRAAALNAQLVTLHRNFGQRRYAGAIPALAASLADNRHLDVVIVTMRDRNVLDATGLDLTPPNCEIQFYEGDPLLLGYECQRIARERIGQYDIYVMLEDDLILHDPDFFDKIAWFNRAFGPNRVLQPHMIEVSKSGSILGKVFISPEVPGRSRLDRAQAGPARLEGVYAERARGFDRAVNPHSGTWIVTGEQLRDWSAKPWFYDRSPDWIDPMASAATRGLSMSFDVFKPGAPDPCFLEVEHYCLHYANHDWTPEGGHFGEDPMMVAAREAYAAAPSGAVPTSVRDLVLSQLQIARLQHENKRLAGILKSRSKLLRHLTRTLLTKPVK